MLLAVFRQRNNDREKRFWNVPVLWNLNSRVTRLHLFTAPKDVNESSLWPQKCSSVISGDDANNIYLYTLYLKLNTVDVRFLSFPSSQHRLLWRQIHILHTHKKKYRHQWNSGKPLRLVVWALWLLCGSISVTADQIDCHNDWKLGERKNVLL